MRIDSAYTELPIHPGKAYTVCHKIVRSSQLAQATDGWNRMMRCQGHKLLAAAIDEMIGIDDQCVGLRIPEHAKAISISSTVLAMSTRICSALARAAWSTSRTT